MRTALFLMTAMAAMSLPVAHAGNPDQGKLLYDMYCTQCHGMNGAGGGVNVPDMAVLPRDHTDAAEMSARSDEELAKAIRLGGAAVNKSVLMPAWDRNLTDQQVADLVAYLRQLCCSQ